jgi:hypothetical protein
MMGGVKPGSLVLLHSPLSTAASWGGLPEQLRLSGYDVRVLEVRADDRPPFAQRYVAYVAQRLERELPIEPVVLVGHGAAGPLLPQIGYARRSAHHPVGGYVFVNADLARPAGPTGPAGRLALLDTAPIEAAEAVWHDLTAGEPAADWAAGSVYGAAEGNPVEGLRASQIALLRASSRPRDAAFYTEPLPCPPDWPDAPCGYLRTSADHAAGARVAAARGWPVARCDSGHFAAVSAPVQTAAILLDLLASL